MLVVRKRLLHQCVLIQFAVFFALKSRASRAVRGQGPCRAKPVSLATVAVCDGCVEPEETERGAVTHWTMHPYCSTHGRLAEDKICALGLHSPGA